MGEVYVVLVADLDSLVVVLWAEGDAEAVAALLQLGLTLSRSGHHAHPGE